MLPGELKDKAAADDVEVTGTGGRGCPVLFGRALFWEDLWAGWHGK